MASHVFGSRSSEVGLLACGLAAFVAALLAVGTAGAGRADAAATCGSPDAEGLVECVYRDPITVRGFGVDQRTIGIDDPDVNGKIVRMQTDIVDADGTQVPINRLMLHHIVFQKDGVVDETCRGKGVTTFDEFHFGVNMGERFYAAGEERAILDLPDGYGYPVQASDSWSTTYMVMNHRKEQDEAFIQYTATIDTTADDLQPVKPYWLDIANCRADPIYNVPGGGGPGSLHDAKMDFTVPSDGRIVAGTGHVHGGAKELRLSEPTCQDRTLAVSEPTWGNPDHPFYTVRPVLHEPGPINMSAFTTDQGIPVNQGETLRLHSIYDNQLPHVRVMGIMVVYVASDPVPSNCGAIPGDIEEHRTSEPGRTDPVEFEVPLIGLDENGDPHEIEQAEGETFQVGQQTTVDVKDNFFSKPNVIAPEGVEVKWNFTTSRMHNVTLANGPIGIGSPNLTAVGSTPRSYTAKLDKPGTYQLFCNLHPVTMHEVIEVEEVPDQPAERPEDPKPFEPPPGGDLKPKPRPSARTLVAKRTARSLTRNRKIAVRVTAVVDGRHRVAARIPAARAMKLGLAAGKGRLGGRMLDIAVKRPFLKQGTSVVKLPLRSGVARKLAEIGKPLKLRIAVEDPSGKQGSRTAMTITTR